MLRTWYRKLAGKGKNTAARARARRRATSLPLRLEALEDRVVPAELTTLASFNGSNGVSPFDFGGLVEDGRGDLFGTTQGGGAYGQGTVFEIAAGSSAVTTLASFTGSNGSAPDAGLVEDSGGNLFGTTLFGGTSGAGTVFEVAAGSNAITTLASFTSSNSLWYPSVYPYAGLMEDGRGDLFGTTANGGAATDGTVFEVVAGSNSVTTLASFTGSNGAYPLGGVIEDGSGDLFGTTARGGAYGQGTVFEIAAGSNAVTTLASFNDSNGAYPHGGLVEDGSGDLFGTTREGGRFEAGTVFEVPAGSNTITVLAFFNGSTGAYPDNGSNGAYPEAGLVEDASGDLFGTTVASGAYGQGTVFEVAAGSNAITALASFTGSNGAYPWGGVIEDGGGDLFGTTQGGGAYGQGTVFEVRMVTAPTLLVSDAGGTYNGNPFPATATVNGGGTLEGVTPTLTYYQGTYSMSNLPSSGGSSTAPTGAGSYTVVASFAGSPDYTSATALATFTIAQATPTVSVTDAGGTYNGSAFVAVGSALGVDGATPVSGSFTFSYYAGTDTSGASLGAVAPSNAGTYTVTASFSSGDANYTGNSAVATFTVSPLAVTLSGSRTYDGTTTAAASILTVTNVVPGDSLTLSGSAPLASANAGPEAVSSFAGLALGGAAAANYTPTGASGSVTVLPAVLPVTTNSSLMLAGTSPPPLTGAVSGTPFTGTVSYTTPFGDTVTVTLGTAASSASAVGQYAVSASLSGPQAGNYVLNLTAGTMYVVSVGPDPSSTTGAQAVTFWDNKGNARLITAADLSSLDALNLVTQGGSAFDPHSVAQLEAWLSVSPNATAAYQLAVQLAAMDLNVLAGYVQGTDLVYAGGLLPYAAADQIAGLTSGGFIDVQDLMQAANAALALVQPGNPSGDPNAAYELALAQALQGANGNSDFVTQELIWGLLGL